MVHVRALAGEGSTGPVAARDEAERAAVPSAAPPCRHGLAGAASASSIAIKAARGSGMPLNARAPWLPALPFPPSGAAGRTFCIWWTLCAAAWCCSPLCGPSSSCATLLVSPAAPLCSPTLCWVTPRQLLGSFRLQGRPGQPHHSRAPPRPLRALPLPKVAPAACTGCS